MIRLGMSAGGTVLLTPRTRGDLRILGAVPYVTRNGQGFYSWWTYLSDLRRDLKDRLQWAPQVGPRLAALVARMDRREQGDDQEVLDLWNPEVPPFPFQYRGIHAIFNTEKLVVGDDTGLGKTIQSLGAMLLAFKRGTARRAVLIVPAGVKVQWCEEIERFARKVPEPVILVTGTRARRKALYRRAWRVLVINPELIRQDYQLLRPLAASAEFVVLDEASCIRNPETETARSIKSLFGRARYRVALTATPIENRLVDLRSVFDFVDRRVFLSHDYFDSRYVNWQIKRFKVRKKNGKEVQVTKQVPKGYRNLGEVRVKIRPACLRRRVADVGLELPKLVVTWESLRLPKKQRELYEAIKERTEKILQGLRGAAMVAPLQALRQVCNSTALMEKGSPAFNKPVHVKIDRLRELLETELAGEQVILFTDYERFVRILARELAIYRPASYTGQQDKHEKQLALDGFRAGDRRLLIATKAGERGHNLQNAAVVINVDLPFNPAAVKQRLGRARRIGSKHQCVRMINMVAEDTIEDRLIRGLFYAKRQLFEEIFDADDFTEADPMQRITYQQVKSLL